MYKLQQPYLEFDHFKFGNKIIQQKLNIQLLQHE